MKTSIITLPIEGYPNLCFVVVNRATGLFVEFQYTIQETVNNEVVDRIYRNNSLSDSHSVLFARYVCSILHKEAIPIVKHQVCKEFESRELFLDSIPDQLREIVRTFEKKITKLYKEYKGREEILSNLSGMPYNGSKKDLIQILSKE
jgi:hypothetical protein